MLNYLRLELFTVIILVLDISLKFMRFIEIDFHFVKKITVAGLLLVKYTPTKEQIANIIIKVLASTRFGELKTKLIVLKRPLD